MNILVTFTDFGMTLIGTRLVSINASNRSFISSFAQNILVAKALLITVGFLVLYVLTSIIPLWNQNSLVLLSSYLIVVGQSFFPNWYFQGIQKMGALTVLNFFSRALYIVLILILVDSHNYFLVNVFNGITWICVSSIAWFLILRKIPLNYRKFKLRGVLDLLKESRFLSLTTLTQSTYRSSAMVIAGFLLNKTDLGIYSIIDKILMLAVNAFIVIFRGLFPKICALVQENSNELKTFYLNFFTRLGAIVLFGSLCIIFFGAEVLSMFPLDIDVDQFSTYFLLIGLFPILLLCNLSIGLSLLSHNLHKAHLSSSLVGLLTMILFGLTLGDLYKVSGLFVGYLIAEFSILIAGLQSLRRRNIGIFYR